MPKRMTNEDIFGRRVTDMTEAERLSAIESLEAMRDEVIFKIENLMEEVMAETGDKRHLKRRFKLGESPNDN